MNRGCHKMTIRQKIEKLLLERGGMTISDLMYELDGNTEGSIRRSLHAMRDDGVIYIRDWAMTQPHQKRYPQPVWDHAQNSKQQPPHSKMRPNSIQQQIENLLLEHGGMTISDLMEEIQGHTKGGISKIVCDMRDAGTIYIKDWEMTQPGQKRHPRPVWDHAKNSKRQPPQSKMRPMPPTSVARLKARRIRKGFDVTHTRYIFKMVKTAREGVGE